MNGKWNVWHVSALCNIHEAYTASNILRIYSNNMNEADILVNPMCFPILFHDPLNDCMNFKKYEY